MEGVGLDDFGVEDIFLLFFNPLDCFDVEIFEDLAGAAAAFAVCFLSFFFSPLVCLTESFFEEDDAGFFKRAGTVFVAFFTAITISFFYNENSILQSILLVPLSHGGTVFTETGDRSQP